MAVSDKSLIARCRRGSTPAWDRLLDLHYDSVARFIFLVDPSLSRREVEEICEALFVGSVNRIDEAKEAPSVRTWFLRDASHRARAIQQRSASASASTPDSDGGEGVEARDVPTGGRLRMLLDRLGGPCRDLLELRYFGELSSEELARAFEMDPRTVHTRLLKCLARLEEFGREEAKDEAESQTTGG